MTTSTPTGTLAQNSTTMSSLEIAKLTNKRHADVCRDIRVIFEQSDMKARLSKFAQSEFRTTPTGGKGLPFTVYRLPRAECDLVISGYSVKYRWAIIQRWHELEKQAAQPTPSITGRWLLSFGVDGQQTLTPIPQDAHVLTLGEFEEMQRRAGYVFLPSGTLQSMAGTLLELAKSPVKLQTPPPPASQPKPTAKPMPGSGWKDPAKAEEVLKSMRFKTGAMYDLSLITPERVEALHKADVIGPRQMIKLKRLMS